ncbi:MAG TPA: nucleotidyltransferase family protein [Burkholderiaceae bacterium]|nr:nucleotidyltransferase family protein [Burkholderiaceae bacterium]
MSNDRERGLEARLIAIVRQSRWFMQALEAVRELQLPSWCIGAGAVRNLVWDALHDKPLPSHLADVDVAYFDAADLSAQRDHELQARLARRCPGVPWEVTNQAGVHLWFERCFGHAVAPLASLEAAIASWPEYATAVGVTLAHDDSVRVLAPLGLEDLFGIVVRRNPARVSVRTYRERVAQKRYAERWPQVRIVPAEIDMSVQLCPFEPEHYGAARALWETTEGVGLSEADAQPEIEKFLARNPGLSLVALAEGRVVGTILVGHDGRRGLIHHLAVAASIRRLGVGRRLVRHGLAALAQAGIRKCHLLVFADNAAGRGFWAAIGAEHRDALAIYSLATSAHA